MTTLASELGGPQVIDALASPLTGAEQRRIAWRLGANLTGAGLLGLGIGLGWLAPDLARPAELLQMLAGLVVGVPVLIEGARGFAARPAHSYTDQLVALAVLASLATGDFVTATLVPLFLELGHLFEERSVAGAQAAIDGRRRRRAPTAVRVVDGGEERVPAEALRPGDVVRVRPGEVIPADGQVRTGHAAVDQAAITGESGFEDVAPGSTVFAGTLDVDGLLHVEVTGTGDDTVLGRVLGILQEVEASKTPALRLLEEYAAVYLPLVLALSAVVLFWSGDLSRSIAVLIVACPCSLVLAGPAAMVASMAASTRQSILVKSASFLERMGEVDTLVLDKTGTLTVGELTVDRVEPAVGDAVEVLALAGRAAQASTHPIARAVAAAAGDLPPVVEATELPGRGVVVHTEAGVLRLGRASWLESEGLTCPSTEHPGPGTWIARDDVVIGYIGLRDRPRLEARQALARLTALGVTRHVLLTGDRRAVAEAVAAELGIANVVAEVLPEQKLEVVRAEQAAGRTVMMVGDGVNDALALAGADVGVAIGARLSEVALGGADVALLTPDLEALPAVVELAARTRRTIAENVAIGLGFSAGMLGLAAAGIISPLAGALLHNLGAMGVVVNSTRLLRK
ncbi:MAG: Cd2+/Zn2+-exporting ATPase [Myxococcota bacterium]